jgi:hypothetical protein
MAVFSVARLDSLEEPLVIAPERYHPGRVLRNAEQGGVPLRDLVTCRSEMVSPGGRHGGQAFLVLDTSDVSEGFIRSNAKLLTQSELGSAKKTIRPGDVLVSRLRPYLRQVGYVDPNLAERENCQLPALCSTEFFVLESRDARSIAFLVPYLLSEGPQGVFAASVEGGHHPRFGREALLRIPVPQRLLAERDRLSGSVEEATEQRRASERMVREAIREAAGLSGAERHAG